MRPLNVLASLAIFLCAVDVVSYSFAGETFNESHVYTLSAGLDGFDFNSIKLKLFFMFLLSCVIVSVALCLHRVPVVKGLHGGRLLMIYAFLLTYIATTGVVQYSVKLMAYRTANQEGFDDKYSIPEKLFEAGEERRNLLYLYLESDEGAFFDEEIFPGLLPNLKRLGAAHAHSFTEVNDVGDFTMGGMVASQCGIRLLTPLGAENFMDRVASYLPAAKCIGDLLKASGYTMEYIGGAAKEFAGKNKFLGTHGFSSVKGAAEGRRPGENGNSWGRFDDVMLDDVYDRYTQLVDSGEPFGLFSLTVDTHAPSGSTSPRCGGLTYNDGKNPMLNSVHCTDKLVGEFITKIRSHSGFENTLLVVGSDHRMHHSTADSLLAKVQKGRRLLSLFVYDGKNSEGELIRTPGTTMDIGATITSYLTNERVVEFGLGRSLRDDKTPSLLATLEGVEENSENVEKFEKFEKFKTRLDQWRSSFMQFWTFPKSVSGGFTVNDNVVKIESSAFKLPVLFELDSSEQIVNIMLINLGGHQDTLMNSNRSMLAIDTCSKIGRGLHGAYCYLYRTDEGQLSRSIVVGQHVSIPSRRDVAQQEESVPPAPVSSKPAPNNEQQQPVRVQEILQHPAPLPRGYIPRRTLRPPRALRSTTPEQHRHTLHHQILRDREQRAQFMTHERIRQRLARQRVLNHQRARARAYSSR